MMTSYVEAQANRDNLATGDLNPKIILRHKVIPEFLDDVGEVGWRRKYATVTTVAGSQSYPLPSTFVKARKVYIPAATSASREYDLPFIGEDPVRVSRAEIATVQAVPSGYYIVQDGSSNWKQLKLEAPADGVYTIIVTYWLYLRFADDTTDVDLATYMPEEIQWALVEGLRRYILLDRFGEGDARFAATDKEYQHAVDRAKNYVELAARNYSIHVR